MRAVATNAFAECSPPKIGKSLIAAQRTGIGSIAGTPCRRRVNRVGLALRR